MGRRRDVVWDGGEMWDGAVIVTVAPWEVFQRNRLATHTGEHVKDPPRCESPRLNSPLPAPTRSACPQHQDFAGVGVAIPDHLQWYRVSKLKEFGACGGVETTHNVTTRSRALEALAEGFASSSHAC